MAAFMPMRGEPIFRGFSRERGNPGSSKATIVGARYPGLLPAEEHKGFTLIEIMVALAVFSLAAMALVRLESATIRGASILDETLVAQMVARNVAILAVTDAAPPTAGRTTGAETNGGRAWAWTRQVSALGDGGVLRIEVAVAAPGGAVLGRLTMVRPARRTA
jgi:general secretion pathway protein I